MTSNLPTDRDALLALTGEKYIGENIFGVLADGGETERHVSAFEAPIEKDETSSLKDEETRSGRSSLSTISDSFSVIRTHARKAVKKSHNVVKSAVGLGSQSGNRGPEWVDAKKDLPHLHEKDASVLKDTLEVANSSYSDGKLYFRKIHIGDYGEVIEWQVKFDHKTRGCQEQARTLKDAARKVKSYLDFKEPGELDERFKHLYEIIRGDKRYDGALILFKEGKGKDWYPWKVKIHHDTRGWTTKSGTLSEAITAMEDHIEYEGATPETQDGAIWDRVFSELERYPKCKVFFKENTELGPDGEPEKVWIMKVDHPIRGVQFEAKSRVFQEAAGQVYDYLAGETKENDNSKA